MRRLNGAPLHLPVAVHAWTMLAGAWSAALLWTETPVYQRPPLVRATGRTPSTTPTGHRQALGRVQDRHVTDLAEQDMTQQARVHTLLAIALAQTHTCCCCWGMLLPPGVASGMVGVPNSHLRACIHAARGATVRLQMHRQPCHHGWQGKAQNLLHVGTQTLCGGCRLLARHSKSASRAAGSRTHVVKAGNVYPTTSLPA